MDTKGTLIGGSVLATAALGLGALVGATSTTTVTLDEAIAKNAEVGQFLDSLKITPTPTPTPSPTDIPTLTPTPTPTPEPTPSGSIGGLPFTPPVLVNPVTITIPAAGGTFTQSNSVDCVISAPVVITGNVTIKGCDDRVWIGAVFSGRTTIPTGSYDTTNRGVRFYDGSDTGTDYFEGFWFKPGTYLSDAIQLAYRTNNARTTIIQQIRVDATTYGTKAGVHADQLQAWGGPRTLHVFGWTGKNVTYQGFYLDAGDGRNLPTGPGEAWTFENVNLEGTSTVKYLFADRQPTFTKATAQDVWIYGSPYNNSDSFGNAPAGVKVGKAFEDYVSVAHWNGTIYTR
jgi:hypothetical protein